MKEPPAVIDRRFSTNEGTTGGHRPPLFHE
jgi:hypothetical protein